jgi:hypothetical protein
MNQLNMTISTFNPYLLYSTKAATSFRIVSIQTNNTLLLTNPTFAIHKQQEIKNTSIKYKPREELTYKKPLKFNSGLILKSHQKITLSQERTYTLIYTIQESNTNTTSSKKKI